MAARQTPPPMNSDCIAGGEVELRAEINDFELWNQVVEQLACLRIYTVKNLAEQMVAVSQKKADEAHRQLEMFSAEATGELEVLRQRVSFLEHENRQLRIANTKWGTWAQQHGHTPKPVDQG
jgi:hypothetical protein